MRENTILTKMQNGQPTVGIWVGLGSVNATEALAQMGFEWFIVCTQHGAWTDETLVQALRVIDPTPTIPIIRVRGNEYSAIGWALDAGAMGIMVPMVNCAEEAQRAVRATYYPPLGSRSFGGSRIWWLDKFSNVREESNEKILLMVQIETAEAVEHADEIAAVEGVDCLFIGPADLSISLAAPRGSDEHEEAVQHVLEVGKEQGVIVGYDCSSLEEIAVRAQQGFLFLSYRSDIAFILDGGREHAAALKSALQ